MGSGASVHREKVEVLMPLTPDERAAAEQQIADAYGLPVEILRPSDRAFHWWLHNTPNGQALLRADAAEEN